MEGISEEVYLPWQKDVIKMFFTDAIRPAKLPLALENGKPVWAIKEKVIVVVLPGKKGDEPNEVKECQQVGQLRTKHKIKLFHLGNKRVEEVSYGYDTKRKQFLYPAFDYGGLTNLPQIPGTEVAFASNDMLEVSCGQATYDVAETLFNAWNNLVRHNLPNERTNFENVVKCIVDAFPDGAVLRFFKLPAEPERHARRFLQDRDAQEVQRQPGVAETHAE